MQWTRQCSTRPYKRWQCLVFTETVPPATCRCMRRTASGLQELCRWAGAGRGRSLAAARKPAEHTALFAGNCDDHFRMGIKLTRWAPFSTSCS